MNFIVLVTCIAGLQCPIPSSGYKIPLKAPSEADCVKNAKAIAYKIGASSFITVKCHHVK